MTKKYRILTKKTVFSQNVNLVKEYPKEKV